MCMSWVHRKRSVVQLVDSQIISTGSSTRKINGPVSCKAGNADESLISNTTQNDCVIWGFWTDRPYGKLRGAFVSIRTL
jgi:hypothetical protein